MKQVLTKLNSRGGISQLVVPTSQRTKDLKVQLNHRYQEFQRTIIIVISDSADDMTIKI